MATTKAQRAEIRQAAVEKATAILKEEEQLKWVLFSNLVQAWERMDAPQRVLVSQLAVRFANDTQDRRKLEARVEKLEEA